MTLVVLVTGARGNDVDPAHVHEVLDIMNPDEVILGDCPSGVDLYAFQWCDARPHIVQWPHFANWDGYGSAAGPRRNGDMVRTAAARADAGADVIVLAFPRGGPGTRDCIAQAEAAGLHVELF